ncbi:hypothetical protein MycrhDRAFT_0947 [Mycolicibacterium rhodesiae JS60]|nr:hypothetical protein MycrhDRAFT_0947 [Mycolicibacterium rhodesiae JS60]
MIRRSAIPAALCLGITIATVLAPGSSADATSDLAGAVGVARSASHCPPLQADPLVERVAQMASANTSDYVNFRTSAVPFTDPMPALATIGYRGSKALLFAGYGTTPADALRGVLLEFRQAKPDCTYTVSGINALGDSTGFYVASVVLAAP